MLEIKVHIVIFCLKVEKMKKKKEQRPYLQFKYLGTDLFSSKNKLGVWMTFLSNINQKFFVDFLSYDFTTLFVSCLDHFPYIIYKISSIVWAEV